MKLALIFPGQGSQYVGMGSELYDIPEARKVFDEADARLGFSLTKLCFEGPEEELKKTSNTQPAILTTSIACLELLKKEGIKPDLVAGHSLGEYSALVAAGAIDFADAVDIVQKRGSFMQDAVPLGKGGMAAILGLDNDKVKEACLNSGDVGIIEVANFNCPGQVVISGEIKALEKAMELAKAAGAKRAILLAVSGPFHSSLMLPAGEKLSSELAKVTLCDPLTPIIANVSADYVKNQEEISKALIKQVSNSVRWEETIEKMIAEGIEIFVEVGPGKVLSGLVKKINRNVQILNVENIETLQNVLVKLREVI